MFFLERDESGKENKITENQGEIAETIYTPFQNVHL
jgi:hypothetical protein